VQVAGPDTSNPQWIARLGEDVGHRVVLQTSHFYAERPPTDPRMTIDYLLSPGERLQTCVLLVVALSQKSGVPYRISEGNTCYAAGKAGASDKFASALWVVDFMFAVAQAGATGVNLHGGGNGLYTPIAGSSHEGYTARPIYYGELMARQLLGSALVRTEVNADGMNVAACAARALDELQVVVLNREREPISCRMIAPAPDRAANGEVWRLEAPSVESKTGVTLAEANVSSEGIFHAAATEQVRIREGSATVKPGPYSAVLIAVAVKVNKTQPYPHPQ
jgi:hypothetical protein